MPTETEAGRIYAYVREKIDALALPPREGGVPVLYAMGGAARNAAKYMINKAGGELDGYRLTRAALWGMAEEFIKNPEAARTDIEGIMPERLTTITPGIITITAIMDATDAREIEIVMNGVREGYLWANIAK